MGRRQNDKWTSDAPISAPVPEDSLEATVMADLGGFVFTPMGLKLPVTSALYQERYTPTWGAPPRPYSGGSHG